MAGDWIRMDLDLPQKPQVVRVAKACGISRQHVVGALHSIWAWFDRNSNDGSVTGIDEAFIDELSGVDGFARAMMDAEWLGAKNGAIWIPDFDVYMSQSAKQRALTARRVETHRQRMRNGGGVTKSLPEKRREEKRTTTRAAPIEPPRIDPQGDDGDGQGEKGKADPAEAARIAALERNGLASAMYLLAEAPDATDREIDLAMAGVSDRAGVGARVDQFRAKIGVVVAGRAGRVKAKRDAAEKLAQFKEQKRAEAWAKEAKGREMDQIRLCRDRILKGLGADELARLKALAIEGAEHDFEARGLRNADPMDETPLRTAMAKIKEAETKAATSSNANSADEPGPEVLSDYGVGPSVLRLLREDDGSPMRLSSVRAGIARGRRIKGLTGLDAERVAEAIAAYDKASGNGKRTSKKSRVSVEQVVERVLPYAEKNGWKSDREWQRVAGGCHHTTLESALDRSPALKRIRDRDKRKVTDGRTARRTKADHAWGDCSHAW